LGVGSRKLSGFLITNFYITSLSLITSRVYSHDEIVLDDRGNIVYDSKGKPKKKKIFKSFTAPTKKEAQFLAAQFSINKKSTKKTDDITLIEAIEKYIELKQTSLSPSTLRDYDITKRFAFKDIMNMKVSNLNEDIIQLSVNRESERFVSRFKNRPRKISTKRLKNEYGLIRTVIHRYRKDIDFEEVTLPKAVKKQKELIDPEIIMEVIKGTDMELPVLLAMWLSFTASEILGLTKSKSLKGNVLTITEVVVLGKDGYIRKEMAKNEYRNRSHVLPDYILKLIDAVETDVIVPMSQQKLYHKWTSILKENNLPHMSFHDLRHVNASVMAMLNIPDKYAQERGGWKTDNIMKSVYQQTFSTERKRVDSKINEYFESKL
jgi:integrase